MKSVIQIMFGALLFISLLCLPSRSFAGIAHISVDPCGAEEFCVFATQISGIKGINLEVSYDSFAMTNVHLDATGLLLGRGSVRSSVGPSGSGRMTFTGSEAVEGNGVVAIIRYQRTSEREQGRITSASVLATDENGVTTSIPVVINNTPEPVYEAENEEESGSGSQKDQNYGAVAEEVPPGREPADRSRREGHGTAEAASQEKAGAEMGQGRPRSGPAPGKRDGIADREKREGRTVYCRGILSSFLELKAERDFAALQTIIDQCRESQFRQEPRLVLSDGKTVVTVSLTLDIRGKKAPVFLLEGARFRTLREFTGNEWEIDLLPDKGVMEARLSVYYDDDRIYGLPIALAPPLQLYSGGKSDVSPDMKQKVDEYVRLVNAYVPPTADSETAASLDPISASSAPAAD